MCMELYLALLYSLLNSQDVSKRTKDHLADFEKEWKEKLVRGQVSMQSFESGLGQL